MSAAKMVADSTQDASDGKKKKKKLKKSGKKVVLPEDEDPDLDLKKDLKPISFYATDRQKMIEEMFHSVRGASLQRALPELLKSIPHEELKLLCLEQLEVMSKKRIRRILAGEESANISSSGTDDDDSSEEENQEGKPQNNSVPEKKQDEGPVADSTSINQESSQKSETDTEHVQTNNEPSQQSTELYPDIEIKQEPPESEPEPEEEYEPEPEEDEMDYEDDVEEEEEEEEEEDPPEAYTSGSEDGELVKRDTSVKENELVEIKQEVLSDSEIQNQTQETENNMESNMLSEKDKLGAEKQNVEEIEGELLSSVETNVGDPGNLVLPSIMMDQMELLELEMRARAIKAMLTSHEEDPDDG